MPSSDPRYNSVTYLPPGAEPPGGWVSGRWVGPVDWRTHHGPSVVRWLLGRAHTVWDARLPDGSRGDVYDTLDRGWRRPSTGPRRWVLGGVDIDPDDVVFIDGEQTSLPLPSPPPAGADPDLEADLAHDAAFVADLRDLRFVEAAHAALCNGDFFKEGRSEWQFVSDKNAACLVTAAADMGDSYHDFAWSVEMKGRMPAERARRVVEMDGVLASCMASAATPEERALWQRLRETGEVGVAQDHPLYIRMTEFGRSRYGVFDDADLFNRMEAHLTRLGWRVPTDAELRERLLVQRRESLNRRVQLLRQVRECEARPAGEQPEWANPVRCVRFRGADLDGIDGVTDEQREAARGELAERICQLAESGRVTEAEMVALRELLS